MTAPATAPLLEVRDLRKHFPVRHGLWSRTTQWVRAVDGITFSVCPGETLGLVGESGSGKTTAGHTILRLIPPTSGQMRFAGQEIQDLSGPALKGLRRSMQIIFQDPYSALDPRMSIEELVAEGLTIHRIGSRRERREIALDMLRRVGLRESFARRYPGELSGGQRQRVVIARALALRPRFIVCDEPVSALDVSVQAQILNLLRDLQAEFGLAYLFVTHNMSVVEHMAQRVAVMYLGRIVELAPRDALFREPLHPYTHALMSVIPVPQPRVRRERIMLRGEMPSPLRPPPGCRFHTRCPVAEERCRQEEPPFREVRPAHWAACWLAG